MNDKYKYNTWKQEIETGVILERKEKKNINDIEKGYVLRLNVTSIK